MKSNPQEKGKGLLVCVLISLFILVLDSKKSLGRPDGEAIFSALLVTALLGFPCCAVVAGLVSYCTQLVTVKGMLQKHLPFILILLGPIAGRWYFIENKTPTSAYPPIPHVQRPISVAGYSRSDGTYVSGYRRAPPGQKGYYDSLQIAALVAWSKELEPYRERDRQTGWEGFFLFCAISGCGGYLLWTRRKSGSRASSGPT